MPGERLTLQDRKVIAAGLRADLTYAEIGRRIGRPTSTVTREVMRHGGPNEYHPEQAHRLSRQVVRRPRTGTVGAEPPDLDGRDPELVAEVAAQSAELMVRSGIPQMMARVLAALFTTDSGTLTSADLVRRLRVSPASISKAVRYLENQALIRRERNPHDRSERYIVDDDMWFHAIMASIRIDTELAHSCTRSAHRLGLTTPAGARLHQMSQFLTHVTEDLTRSVHHWRNTLT